MKSKIVSVLIMFAMVLLILFTVYLLYGSILFWLATFKTATQIITKLYLGGLLMAIVSGILFFLKMFINTLGEAIGAMKDKP